MGWMWIDNKPNPNCKHETAYITGDYTDECTSRGYFEIYCPECNGRWDERSKNCKYERPKTK